jgi:hypothetical protein
VAVVAVVVESSVVPAELVVQLVPRPVYRGVATARLVKVVSP